MLGNKLLIGEKVRLTAFTREDIPIQTLWFNDLEMLGNLWRRAVFPQNEDNGVEWYDRMRQDNHVHFAMRTLETNQLIGGCSLRKFDWRNRACMFAIHIGEPDFRSKGYGTDATRVSLRYAFLELNLNRVELVVIDSNKRAIRAYEKSGFVYEYTNRQAIFHGGRYADVIGMSILHEEWLALNS